MADMIVSYQWMAECHMDVHPKKHAISINQPHGVVWVQGARAPIQTVPNESVAYVNDTRAGPNGPVV